MHVSIRVACPMMPWFLLPWMLEMYVLARRTKDAWLLKVSPLRHCSDELWTLLVPFCRPCLWSPLIILGAASDGWISFLWDLLLRACMLARIVSLAFAACSKALNDFPKLSCRSSSGTEILCILQSSQRDTEIGAASQHQTGRMDGHDGFIWSAAAGLHCRQS